MAGILQFSLYAIDQQSLAKSLAVATSASSFCSHERLVHANEIEI